VQGFRSAPGNLDLLIGRDHERLEAGPRRADPPLALDGRDVAARASRSWSAATPLMNADTPGVVNSICR
jgi:hypothetical protein